MAKDEADGRLKGRRRIAAFSRIKNGHACRKDGVSALTPPDFAKTYHTMTTLDVIAAELKSTYHFI